VYGKNGEQLQETERRQGVGVPWRLSIKVEPNQVSRPDDPAQPSVGSVSPVVHPRKGDRGPPRQGGGPRAFYHNSRTRI